MTASKTGTKAINLRIEHEHEQLVRDVISRIRKGGPGFRAALRALIEDERAAEYVPAHELHARFADIEKRLRDGISAEAQFVPAEEIETRFTALEERLIEMSRQTGETYVPESEIRAQFAETEQRLREIEQMALARISRLGADSCGG
ncbi:hypothetical protein R3X27_11085 [Tropicimonas sp. TH_r6]|uniref:hypothetical protein n=1 Tax=Tropicimonas sp. TH_r6 TaxID=3082085 RepID=UPI0029552A9A|nr:hypothetical protein [Tropicimonas sp. TH_r6]MDV7143225.1 hypothetical protein [Tropicimonas sp. TH_r6]